MILLRKIYYYMKRLMNGGKPCCDELVFRKRLKVRKLNLREKCKTIAKHLGDAHLSGYYNTKYRYNDNNISIRYRTGMKLTVEVDDDMVLDVDEYEIIRHKLSHINKFKAGDWIDFVDDKYDKAIRKKESYEIEKRREKTQEKMNKLRDKWNINPNECVLTDC